MNLRRRVACLLFHARPRAHPTLNYGNGTGWAACQPRSCFGFGIHQRHDHRASRDGKHQRSRGKFTKYLNYEPHQRHPPSCSNGLWRQVGPLTSSVRLNESRKEPDAGSHFDPRRLLRCFRETVLIDVARSTAGGGGGAVAYHERGAEPSRRSGRQRRVPRTLGSGFRSSTASFRRRIGPSRPGAAAGCREVLLVAPVDCRSSRSPAGQGRARCVGGAVQSGAVAHEPWLVGFLVLRYTTPDERVFLVVSRNYDLLSAPRWVGLPNVPLNLFHGRPQVLDRR